MSEIEKTTSEDKPKKKHSYKRKYMRKPKGEMPAVVTDTVPVTDRDGMEAIVEPEIVPVTEDLEAVLMKDVVLSGPVKREDLGAVTMATVKPHSFRLPVMEKKTKKVWGKGAVLMSNMPSRKC
jgi:hypothetical protein